jgi:hypothetical protein
MTPAVLGVLRNRAVSISLLAVVLLQCPAVYQTCPSCPFSLNHIPSPRPPSAIDPSSSLSWQHGASFSSSLAWRPSVKYQSTINLCISSAYVLLLFHSPLTLMDVIDGRIHSSHVFYHRCPRVRPPLFMFRNANIRSRTSAHHAEYGHTVVRRSFSRSYSPFSVRM